ERRSVSGPSPESALQREPPRPHLLIVEDDPDTLEMLRTTLEARGDRVTAHESAADAVRHPPDSVFGLIISHIRIPEIDGFEMMKQLREWSSFQEVPAIALSGYASQKDAKAALSAGFNAHVSKPVDPDDLIKMIKGLLEKAKV